MGWGWVKDNRPRPGFEYRYRFQTTDCDEIITDKVRSRFGSTDEIRSCFGGSVLSGSEFACFLEFRTNFILRKAAGGGEEEIVLGSQRFEVNFGDCDEEDGFVALVCGFGVLPRLQEYWMPDSQILRLTQDAFANLAKSMSVGPPRMIPIVVWVDVCTVQQDGETLDEAMDRAITPDRLLPYEVFDFCSIDNIDEDLLEFLIFELPRIRVEDVEQGLGLMKSCPMCPRGPTVGSQITIVPSCAHAFHSHCIVGWMVKDKSKSCPLCLQHKST